MRQVDQRRWAAVVAVVAVAVAADSDFPMLTQTF